MAKKLTDEQLQKLRELHTLKMPTNDIAKQLGVSRRTVGKRLNQMGLVPNYVLHKSIVRDNDRQCNKCFCWKLKTEFSPNDTVCLECKQKYNYIYRSNLDNYLKSKILSIKSRSDYVDIDVNYLSNLYHIQKGSCFYTNIQLDWKPGRGMTNTSLAVDQVKPGYGYVQGNVVLASVGANNSKSNHPLDYLQLWMPAWYEKIQQGYRDGVLY